MKATGWGIAVIAVGIAAWMGISNQQLRRELMKPSPAAPEAVPVEPEVTPPAESAPAPPAPVVQAPPEPEPAEDPEAKKKRERERRMVKAQLGIVMDMAYRPLYNELNIAPETVTQMRELIVEAADRDRIAAEQAMKKKEVPASEVNRKKDENKAWLHEELAKVLTREELAGFVAYEDYAEQILYETLLDGQLTMMAPGLSPENREAVKEVFAEELIIAINAYEASDELYTLDGFNDAQLTALNAGLQRLRFSIPQDQYDQAAGFNSQVEAMFKAMSDRE